MVCSGVTFLFRLHSNVTLIKIQFSSEYLCSAVGTIKLMIIGVVAPSVGFLSGRHFFKNRLDHFVTVSFAVDCKPLGDFFPMNRICNQCQGAMRVSGATFSKESALLNADIQINGVL